MPKFVCLDSAFMAPFRRKLHGGLGLGWRMAERELTPCTLAVWLPDDVTTVPSDLNQDFEGYETRFNIRDELFAVLDAHGYQPHQLLFIARYKFCCGKREPESPVLGEYT